MGAQLLSQEQMDRSMETSVAFLQMIQDKEKSFLEKCITMDESAVSMHMPEPKMKSKQWLKKSTPDPIKAKVTASSMKKMVIAIFNIKIVIYTNQVTQGCHCQQRLHYQSPEEHPESSPPE
jgi:hypothetical protein